MPFTQRDEVFAEHLGDIGPGARRLVRRNWSIFGMV